MSYILDAIARSEQERRQQQGPGVEMLAAPIDNPQRPRSLLAPLVITALLVNAALIGLWLFSSRPGAENTLATAAPASEQDTRRETGAVVPPARPLKLITMTPQAAAIQDTGSQPIDVSTHQDPQASPPPPGDQVRSAEMTDAAPRAVSRISDLPADVRRDLPRVVFSGHLYSSNPDSSIIFVDNERPVRRGQKVSNELYLHEITPTGVVVEFRGYLIEVGVLQNWSLD